MSKKKVKGTKIDLSTLGVDGGPAALAALPKGPKERAADDEGRFRRTHPGDRGGDRGGGFGGDRGGGGGFGGGRGGGRY